MIPTHSYEFTAINFLYKNKLKLSMAIYHMGSGSRYVINELGNVIRDEKELTGLELVGGITPGTKLLPQDDPLYDKLPLNVPPQKEDNLLFLHYTGRENWWKLVELPREPPYLLLRRDYKPKKWKEWLCSNSRVIDMVE